MLNIRDTERIHIWSEGRQCIQKDDRLLWKVSQLSSHAAFHLNCQIACRTSEKSSADIRSRTQELRLRGKTVCSESRQAPLEDKPACFLCNPPVLIACSTFWRDGVDVRDGFTRDATRGKIMYLERRQANMTGSRLSPHVVFQLTNLMIRRTLEICKTKQTELRPRRKECTEIVGNRH